MTITLFSLNFITKLACLAFALETFSLSFLTNLDYDLRVYDKYSSYKPVS